MKSVANIGKITKAMKMVAASKMRSAQVNTMNSRGIAEPLLKLLGDLPDAQGKKNVYVPITSDKGLCGGINTTVCKYTRASIKAEDGEDKEHSIVVLGEKGRSQLQRDLRASIHSTVADTGKVRVTFAQAAAIADGINTTEFDVARLIFNRFHSAISYKPTIATVLSPDVSGRWRGAKMGGGGRGGWLLGGSMWKTPSEHGWWGGLVRHWRICTPHLAPPGLV